MPSSILASRARLYTDRARTLRTWAILAGILVLVAGCADDQVRDDVPPLWTAASDPSALYPVDFARPGGAGKLTTALVELDGEPARIGCPTCHSEGSVPAIARNNSGADVHAAIVLTHGELQCGACHAPEMPGDLHDATGQRIAIEDSMELCSQCHGPIRRAYDNGAHGGMRGYWDLQRGPRTRNSCVACHNPHVPAIPRVTPVPGPADQSDRKPYHPGSAIEQRLLGDGHE